jgi:membrane protease YdiL (CAAX protease family)
MMTHADELVYKLIWNNTENRPRTFLRLVLAIIPIGLVLWVLSMVGGIILSVMPVGGLSDGPIWGMVSMTGAQVYGAVVITSAIVIAAWTVDCRRLIVPNYQSVKRWVSDLMFGLLLGLMLQGGILFVGLATQSIRITATFTGQAGQTPLFWILNLVIFYLCIGLREEIIFRWYLLNNLAEGFSWFDQIDRHMAVWAGIGVSAVAFSLWHTGSTVQFLIFAACFGLLFGLLYALIGSVRTFHG